MPGGNKTYKVGNDVYNIPDTEAGSFLKDYPNASEVKSYTVGKDTFDIPVNEVPDFVKENKEAREVGQSPHPEQPKTLPQHYEQQGFLIDQLVPKNNQPKVTGDVQGMPGVKPLSSNMQDKSIEQEGEARKAATKQLKSEAVINSVKRKHKNLGLPIDENSRLFKNDVDLTKNALDKGDIVITNDKEGKPTTTRGSGFAETLINTIAQSVKAPIEAYKVNTISDPKELADFFDDKRNREPDIAPSKPSGIGGAFGEVLGGAVKPIALASIPYAGQSAMVSEAYFTSVAAHKQELYEKGLEQLTSEGVPLEKARIEAAQKAIDTAGLEAVPDAAVAYALSRTLHETPEEASKSPAVEAFKSAVAKTAKDAGRMGVIGSAGEAGKIAVEKVKGYDISKEDALNKIVNGFTDFAAMDLMFKVAANPAAFPKHLVAMAKEGLKALPPEVVSTLAPPEVQQGLSNYENARAKLPDNILPESSAHPTGLIEKQESIQSKIKELEAAKEGKHPSLTKDTDEQISALKEQSKAIDGQLEKMAKSNDPSVHEVDELTGEKPVDVKNLPEETPKTETDAIQEPSPEQMGTHDGGNETVRREESTQGVGESNGLQEPAGTRGGQGEEIKGAPDEDAQKKAEPIKEFTSSKGHKLTVENGELKVTNGKTGKELSPKPRKEVIAEAVSQYDFTQGKEAPVPDFEPASQEEHLRHVIENTTSPVELADVYLGEEPVGKGLSTKEQMIADYGMGKVTEGSYRDFADKNSQNHNKARAYFSKNGMPIDSLAKELSDHYDVDISPQDIVDFIDRFPNGADAATAMHESSIAKMAKDRFSELTGLPLDKETAQVAIKQQFEKLSKEAQQIAQEDYDNEEQLREAYDQYLKETNNAGETTADSEVGKGEDAAGKTTTQQASVADVPILKEFIEHDVKPQLEKIGLTFKSALRGIVNALSPKTGVSEKAITHLMTALGTRNEASMQVDKALHSIEKMFDKMPDADRISFIDKMKRGEPQATKELDDIATAIRELDKSLYDEITKYKPDLTWKENHYRVLWKVIPGSGKEKFWSSLTRRPFQGSKGFMRQATLIDMSEGIAKGGVPESTNPVRMFKLAYADGMKYVTAQRMFEALKKDKMVQFVKLGERAPDGFVQLNDRLAKVYFKTDAGLVNAGEYYIEEGAGRLLNNHLSVDYLRQKDTNLGKIGSGLMEIKNLYTQAELGLSAFHAVAESMEAVSSTLGVGIRKLVNLGLRGDFKSAGEGIMDILKSPFAPATTFKTGRAAIRFASEKDFAASNFGKEFLAKFPDAEQYVHDFFIGGGLMKQHDDLRATTFDALKEHTGKNNYIGATLRALPALNETVMSPLFNYYIPALKVGMFFREFPLTLKENEARLNKGQITREELARKSIDFIDDRLGEMNFDNLFWDRTFKTSMQFMMRSVTWKMGNIRAMMGAPIEQGMEFIHAAKENRSPLLMPKMAWLFGLSTMQVVLASTIQHMLAHKPVQNLKDIVAPQINPDDETERVILPTYYKDMLHLWHSPSGYISTSSSGPIGKIADIWRNRDFYNYEIHDEHDTWLQKRKDDLRYFIPKPFSFTSAAQMIQNNEPAYKVGLSFIGINKAPGYLTHTEIENKIFDLYNLRNSTAKPKAEKEANDAKKEIKRLYKEGNTKDAQAMADEAVKKGTLRATQLKYLYRNVNKKDNASLYFYKTLPFDDRKYLVSLMTDEEKKIYDPRGTVQREVDKTP